MKGLYSSLASKKKCWVLSLFLLLTISFAKADCDTPTGLSVVNLSTNAATLSWTQPNPGSQMQYDYVVSSNEVTSANWSSYSASTAGVVAYGAKVALDLTQLDISGLQAATKYYVLLRQNCEWNYAETSEWVTASFSTLCESAALASFTDTVKFDSDVLPSCWLGAGETLPVLQNSYKYGSTGYAVKLQNSTSATPMLVSPVIQGASSASEIVFRAYSSSGKQPFKVSVAGLNNGSLDFSSGLIPIYEDSTVAGQWIEYVVNDKDAFFSDGYVYVISVDAGNAATVYVDNIIIRELSTCPRPSAVTVSNITESAATFAWTENGSATAWILEFTPDGGEAFTIDASSNPFTYSSLEQNKNYTVRVKANCGDSQSDYCSVTSSFKTDCGIKTLPFSENFNSYTIGTTPDCFTTYASGSSSATVASIYSSSSSSTCLKLNQYYSTGIPVYAVLPQFNTEVNKLRAQFKYRYESSTNGTFEVGYMTDKSDVSTFVPVDTLAGVMTFTSATVLFENVPAAAAYIAFRFTSSSSYYYGAIDDLVIDLAPSCKAPTDLVLQSYDDTQAIFTWKQPSEASKWELVWSNGSNSGTEIITSTPSFTISGLTEQTTYTPNFKIRAICQEGDTSEVLSKSFSFKTKCSPIALPYYESFDNKEIPSCWEVEGYQYYSYGYTTKTWESSAAGYDGSYGVRYYKPYSSSITDSCAVLKTPKVSLTENARLSFNFMSADSTELRFSVKLYIDGDMANPVVLDTSLVSSSWTKKVYDLSAYTGKTVMAAFTAKNLNTSSSGYIYLDNVEFEALSACPRPEKAWIDSITDNSANVYVLGGAGDIVVNYGKNLLATATKSATSDTTIIALTGLTETTDYWAVVYAQYDATNQSRPLDTITFKTDQTPATLPYTATDYSDWLLFNGEEENYWKAMDDSLCIVNKVNSMEEKGYASANSEYSNVYATRSFTVDEEGLYTISFKWRAKGESSYDFLRPALAPISYEIEAGTGNRSQLPDGWTLLGTSFYLNQKDSLQDFNADITLQAGTYRLVLYWQNDGSTFNQPGAIVSDVTIHQQMCPYPDKLSVSNLYSDSATISWNSVSASSYDVKLFEGTTLPSDIDAATAASTIEDVALTSATFKGLKPNTDYIATLRSDCGVSGTSKWSSTGVSFHTLCAAQALPYTETFESDSTSHLDCWTIKKRDNGYYTTTTSTSSVHSGKQAWYGKKVTLTSMELAFGEGKNLSNYLISGFAKPYTDSLSFTIGIQTSATDAETFQMVSTVVLPSASSWTEFTYSLAPFAQLEDIADYKYIVLDLNADNYVYLDDITIEEIPSCPKLKSVSVSDITDASAVIDWKLNGTESQWKVCVKDTALVKSEIVTAHPYTLTGLQSSTAYTVDVYAVCGEGDTSAVQSASFKTPCTAATLPYTEDFNSLTSAQEIPDCWDNEEGKYEGDYYSYYWQYNASGYESTPCVSYYGSSYYGETNYLKTIPIQITENARVSFSYKITEPYYSYYSVGLDVLLSTDGGATYPDTLVANLPYTSTFADTVINLDSRFVGKTITLVFKGTSEYSYYPVSIDNLKVEAIPACEVSKSMQVEILDKTINSARLTVHDSTQTSLRWQYAIGKKGFAVAKATAIDVTTDTVLLSGLESGTVYTVYVRQYCSDGTSVSPWNNGTTFKTVAAIPYEENFNELTTSGSIPEGWNNTKGTTITSSYKWCYSSEGYKSTPCVKFNSYYNSSQLNNYLCTEPIVITEEAQVSFFYRKEDGSKLDVYVSTDGGATYNYADTLVAGLPGTNNEFVEYVDNLDSRFVGQTISLVFKATSNYGYMNSGSSSTSHVFLDSLRLYKKPECDIPKALTLFNYSSNTAWASITRRADQTDATFEYALVKADSAVSKATPVACPVNDTIVLTGLQPHTDYDLYVRNACSAESHSAWTKVSFTTRCTAVTMPYSEDFSGLSSSLKIPECWNNEEGSTTDASYRWSYYATGYNSTSCVRFNSYYNSTGKTNFLKTVPIAISEKARLSFMYKKQAGSGLDVYLSTDWGATYADTLAQSIGGVNDFTEYIVDIPSKYVGSEVVIVFKATSNCGSGDAYIYLDDVSVTAVPDCDIPKEVTVISYAQETAKAKIIRRDGQSAATFEYAIVKGDSAVSKATPVTCPTNDTILISGLQAATAYDLYVRTACDAGVYSDWTNAVRFTTLCNPSDLPYKENFGTNTITEYDTIEVPSCWTVLNGEEIISYSNYSSASYARVASSTTYYSNYGVAGNYLYMAVIKDATKQPLCAVLPEFSETIDQLKISFTTKFSASSSNYYIYDTLLLGYMTDATDANSFVKIAKVPQASTSSTSETHTYLLSDYNVPAIHASLAFRYTSSYSYNCYYVGIDDISVVKPNYPIGLHTTATSQSGASLAWNAFENATEYQTMLVHGTDTVRNIVSSNAEDLTGLTVGTEYNYLVRAIIAVGDTSEWSNAYLFATKPMAITFPYTNGFEDDTENAQWRMANSTTNKWVVGAATSAIKDGSKALYISNDDGVTNAYTLNGAAVSYIYRTIDFEAGEYAFSFDWKAYGESSFDYLAAFLVPTSEQLTADTYTGSTSKAPKTWTSLKSGSTIYLNTASSWQSAMYILNIPSDTTLNLVFMWKNDGSGGTNPPAAIDNLKIEKSLCSSLTTQPTISHLEATAAVLSWERDADGVELRLGTDKNIATSGTALVDIVVSTDTFYRFSNLEEQTTYYVAYRTACQSGDSIAYGIEWNTISFETPCLPLAMPYSEDFETSVLAAPTCWNLYSGLFNAETILTSALSSYTGGWNYVTTGKGITENHVKVNNYGTSSKYWLVTPSIIIDKADANLIFDVALTKYGDSIAVVAGKQTDDRFIVAISKDNGSSWSKTDAREWNNSGSGYVYDKIPNKASTINMPLSAYMGDTIRIAFYAESTESGGDNDLHVGNIKVFSGNVVDVKDTVCANSDYSGYGQNISKDKLTPGTTSNFSGFAETAGVTTLYNLELYVRPDARTVVYDTVCANTYYGEYGFDLPTPETRVYVLPTGRLYTADGCDSIVELHLYVPQSEFTKELTICENDAPYQFGELSITESGVYTQTFTSTMGCDSTVTLDLTILPTQTEITRTICEGDTVTVGTEKFYTSGDHVVTLKNVMNCDSTVTLHLTVRGKEVYEYTGYLCENGSYTDKNFSALTTAGLYKDTLQSSLGCDSIIQLNLVLAEKKNVAISETICDGDIYTFNGKDLTSSGTYTETFTSWVGCDSIVTLTLNVLPAAESSAELTLNTDQLPYTFATTADSTYVIKDLAEGDHWLDINMANAAANGCDSVINLTVHIKQPESVDYVSEGVLTIAPNIIEREGTVFVRNTFGENSTVTVELFDAVGRRVSLKTMSGRDMAIDGFHTSGMYMVRVTDADKRTYIGQVIVK